jgi:hypothetical protein
MPVLSCWVICPCGAWCVLGAVLTNRVIRADSFLLWGFYFWGSLPLLLLPWPVQTYIISSGWFLMILFLAHGCQAVHVQILTINLSCSVKGSIWAEANALLCVAHTCKGKTLSILWHKSQRCRQMQDSCMTLALMPQWCSFGSLDLLNISRFQLTMDLTFIKCESVTN